LKLREQHDSIRCKQLKQIALALFRNKQDSMQAYYISGYRLEVLLRYSLFGELFPVEKLSKALRALYPNRLCI